MRAPRILPLSATPGFIACGPGRPMTDEQRERVFGANGQAFVNHLAALVTGFTPHQSGTDEPLAASPPRRPSTERQSQHMPIQEAKPHAQPTA